ncbi:MAG: MATE family efflux transporter [Prevotella sp.]|nr:MATE family efflux transporter [Prevotella sp.]MCH3991194.1 MATE family efflux transporter [Prevotella sp.]MCI1474985.1 MATE family efflux transporter [Prevotella sp.]MCI1519036.1 MATE family efflux transporter [Prevotella sp.]MCI1550337.1 MATE family efflux transporter [Prevotella sp.]MCI2088382.1 MATE family efflux transporter [Prevotella sp.]
MSDRFHQIFRLALPSIISNITIPLLGLCDVAIVGHIGDARYIAAISVGTMIFNVLYWVFGFLRMGTGGMTSQALGRRDLAEDMRLLLRALSIGFGMGVLFVLFQKPVIGIGLWAMGPSADITRLCERYCFIVIWGAPAVLSLYGFTGWYVGMQNTRFPMFVSILQNIINVIASLSLVFGARLDIEGVAFGTLIAQWSGFLIAVSFWLVNYRRLWKHLKDTAGGWRGNMRAWGEFFKVNRDIFIRTLFIVAVSLSFTAIGSRQGAVILAVNTLLMEFFTIFSYFTDGFAYAGEALGGKYYGAKNRKAFQDMVRSFFQLGFVIMLLFTLLYAIGGKPFLSLLTSDRNVITAAGPYFYWAVAIPFAGVAAFLFDGIFVGIMNTKGLLISSVIAAVCYFVVYILFRKVLGNHALWLAFDTYLLARGVVEAGLFWRLKVKD